MALDFLDDIIDGGLGDVVKIGASLYDLFRGHGSQSADQMSALLGASVNPNDPKFKNLAALFEQRAKQDALTGIQKAINQNARSKARGGVGFGINPERRDEAKYGAIAEAFMKAAQQGQQQAYTALSGAAGGYAPLVGYDTGRDDLLSQQIGAGAEGIAELINLFKSNPVTLSGNLPSEIARNPYDVQRAYPVGEF